MRDLVEGSILMGLGALSLTREKAERIVSELVRRGEAHGDETRKLVDQLVARGEEERRAVRKLLEDELADALARMGLARQKDVEALGKKIDRLMKKLQAE
ncbi:MAG TPA: hypothetical protein DCP08_03705 [Chloroflexi bacterium]|nr:hypothetical protein [Chloroflexota bacterium]